jgi:hypothetical protein
MTKSSRDDKGRHLSSARREIRERRALAFHHHEDRMKITIEYCTL